MDISNFDPLKLIILSLRLFPLFLFFTYMIFTIIHNNMNGLLYISGLFISFVIAIPISQTGILVYNTTEQISPDSRCNLGSAGIQGRYSDIPLGILTVSYTFGSIMYFIAKYNLVNINMTPIIFFPVMILILIYFQRMYRCSNWFAIFAAIILGGGIGSAIHVLYDELGIYNKNTPQLLYQT